MFSKVIKSIIAIFLSLFFYIVSEILNVVKLAVIFRIIYLKVIFFIS